MPLFRVQRVSLVLSAPLVDQPSFEDDIALLVPNVARELTFPEGADGAAADRLPEPSRHTHLLSGQSSALELQHLTAAVTGQPSPKDHLYYSTEVKPDLAVGYVTLRTQIARPDALWGDWFVVDAGQNLASGDVLVNIDRSTGCRACATSAAR